MTRVRLARVFWIGAAAILVVAALVALLAVLSGDFSDTDGRILGTLGAALLAGSTVIAGLALVERGGTLSGWAAVTVALPAFAALVYAIWDFVFDGGGDSWRWGWAGALALVATLVAATARLLARTQWIVRLAEVTGALAAVAAGVTIWAIWAEDPGDAAGRAIATLWILAGLGYLLVPVLQRFTSAGSSQAPERVLATLDGVELVATRSRDDTIDVRLAPGERLALRRHG